MDIGAEISKKIQMAITAKLKELDAYVDDELPDYIMIMVANRKTETQMTEALSLFLSGNTKTFTSWLHSLLATLRKTKSDKKEDAFHERKSSLGEQEPEEKMEKDSAGNTKQLEKVPENVSNEPIISINPESHDFLDEELQTETLTTAIAKSDNKISAPAVLVTENKAPPSKSDIEYKVSRLQSKTVTKDFTIEKLSKNKIKLAETKEKEQTASQKRVKLSRRETSTSTDKKTESRRRTKSPRSSESQGVKSDPKKVREWDMGKEDGSILKRRHKPVDRYSEVSSDGDGEIPEKRKGAVSSAISHVPRDPSFVSDSDSDDAYPKNKISSKVAYPKRKMRVPLNKQANRALLIRAVSEAEKSVKPRPYSGEEGKESSSSRSKPKRRSRTSSSTDNKRSEKISRADERLHASRQEQRQSSMTRQSVKLRLGPTPPRKRQLEDSIPVEVGPKVKQEVRLIPEKKPTPVPAKSPKTDLQKKTKIRIKRSSEVEKKTVQPVFGDQRKFIIQDTSSVKFDQRQTKHHSDAPSEESYEDSTKKKRVMARVSPRLHNPEQQQQPRPVTSPSGPSIAQAISPTVPRIMAQAISPTGPRFIVTLDGVVSSKQTVYNEAVNIKETRAQRFAPAPIIAPTPQALVQPTKTKPPLIFKAQNPVVIPATDVDEDSDIGKHTTSSEMEKMKKKILEVQEEAMKLKKMQAKLASLQAGQRAPSKPTIAMIKDTLSPEQRSICVANVHFSTSEKQLSDYFSICGKITRVTILKDAFTGHPKGFAYLEFDDKNAASASLAFDNTSLNNRVIRVTMKQNKPAAAFPITRGRFLTRRSRARGRGIRAFPYKQNIRRGSLTGATKMVTRNKTWVNPLVAKK